MAYKRNHTVPKTLLKQWACKNSDNMEGVFVYEITKNKQYFSTSEGRGAFSFARSNYLYVPQINGNRNPDLEKWKGDLESTLSEFINIILNKDKKVKLRNKDHLAKVLMSIFLIGCTSKYDLEATFNYLEENPDKKKLISGNPNRDTKILALENIINSVTEAVGSYNGVEFTVLKSHDDNQFIYCDRPFIEKPFDETSFIVLSKNIMLAFRNTIEISSISYRECNPDFANTLNEIMVERSREWIIAASEDSLNNYKVIINSERWLESKANDKPYYHPVKFLKSGNYFRE